MTLPETSSSRWAAMEGVPFPLGPTRMEEEDACNFALYSKHAESVTLLLYTESDIVNPVVAYRFDPDGNYWGYMPLNFFSPHHGYLSDHTVKAQHNEVREMIRQRPCCRVATKATREHHGQPDR